MLHNDAAQHRAGEQPSASAPMASQKPPRAQIAAKFKIPSRRQADCHQENGVGTGPRAGDNDTQPIHIGDKHSPPSQSTTHDTATHATMQQPLHQDGLMTDQPLAHMYQQQPARYHSLGDGHVQAFSAFGPELDTLQKQLCEVQDTTAASLTDGNMETPHIIHIHGRHSPPRLLNTHFTLLKSSNRPMAAARRRQGQQLYAWHGTPSRRPQAAPPFPLTPAGEVIQPQPPALPPEAWPSECNTNKAKQPKRDKVFLNTTHC